MAFIGKKSGLVMALVGAVFLAPSVQALEITYEQLSQSGSYYEYSYTLTNTSSFDIEEFSIFFEVGSYENLQVLSSPTDWDPLAVEPAFLFDGFIDWLALGDVITQGETLGGFNVAFNWVGLGGSPFEGQIFEVFDPLTFDVLADGETVKAQDPVDVPAPAMWILVLSGLSLSGFMRRSRRW